LRNGKPKRNVWLLIVKTGGVYAGFDTLRSRRPETAAAVLGGCEKNPRRDLAQMPQAFVRD